MNGRDDRMEELADLWRRQAINNERVSAALLAVVRVLARDTLAVLDTSPSDPLRPAILRGARRRAERIMADLGDDERAN